MERCLKDGEWGGYAGGDAPGVMFENCYWSQEKQIAALCMDTWGCEVRPNETTEANQPWHWVVIPAMGDRRLLWRARTFSHRQFFLQKYRKQPKQQIYFLNSSSRGFNEEP